MSSIGSDSFCKTRLLLLAMLAITSPYGCSNNVPNETAAEPRRDAVPKTVQPATGDTADGVKTAARFESEEHGFSLTVPKGWAAYPTSYSVMHYRDIFLCINSDGNRDLRVTNKRHDSGASYNGKTVAEQLKPGTVYIDLAYFEGPGTGPHYGKGREDSVATDLAPLLKGLEAKITGDGQLSTIHLSFIKWGRSWSFNVYFREPVAPETREQAWDLLRSFQFREIPQDHLIWAVGEAWKRLPAEAQPEVPWPAQNNARSGLHQTSVEKRDNGFAVRFDLLDETGLKTAQSWNFLVEHDGTVAVMPGQK